MDEVTGRKGISMGELSRESMAHRLAKADPGRAIVYSAKTGKVDSQATGKMAADSFADGLNKPAVFGKTARQLASETQRK